jgi:uncharacterized membrane protein
MRDWIYTDLLAISSVTVLTPVMVLLFGFEGNSLQVLAGLVFVFFAPGYALVSFLLPATHVRGLGMQSNNPTEVLLVERSLLSVGLSIALVPMIGIVLHFLQGGVDARPLLVAVSALTLVLSIGAMGRRAQLTPGHEFRISSVREQFRSVFAGAGSDQEVYLNILFVAGMILAVLGVGTAVAMSGGGEQFTEFYIQAEDPETGDMVTDAYPTEMTVGEQSEFVVGITNQEHGSQEYTVVVEIHRVENNQVVEVSSVEQFNRTLEHGESLEERISLDPDLTGENLRVSFQLYRDTPSAGLSVDDAYRHVFFWSDISSAGGEPTVEDVSTTGDKYTAATSSIRPVSR